MKGVMEAVTAMAMKRNGKTRIGNYEMKGVARRRDITPEMEETRNMIEKNRKKIL